MVAWKIERWSTEIRRDTEKLVEEYRPLTSRELSIVACAVLDVALAELISHRLLDDPTECEECLGLNGDGRAPVASFGSRIQLGYLLGVIPKRALPLLRGLKELRNAMAHRVNVSLLDPRAQKALEKMRLDLIALGPDAVAFAERSKTDETAARLLVLDTFATVNHVITRQSDDMIRVEALTASGRAAQQRDELDEGS